MSSTPVMKITCLLSKIFLIHERLVSPVTRSTFKSSSVFFHNNESLIFIVDENVSVSVMRIASCIRHVAHSGRSMLLGGGVVGLVTACSTAASVFFDTPEKPKQEVVAPPPSTAALESASADTTRPPIEATLDTARVLALLPRDEGGHIDWVAALTDGVIDPSRQLPGQEPPPIMDGFRFDFALKGPAAMFDASFPHSTHVQWLTCETCHSRIFVYRDTPITMEMVTKGEACGQCHGAVAFPATNCYRCHAGVSPSGQQNPKLVTDITFTRRVDSTEAETGTETYPPARFAHWVHRIRYRCMACHPTPFEARAGDNSITMADLRAGRACGACHNGDTAFGILQCGRCHVPVEPEQSKLQ